MNQQEVPSNRPVEVDNHKGYRVYKEGDTFVAYRSGKHIVEAIKVNKKTGEETEILKPTAIDRVVLPGTTLEEAMQGLRNYLTPKKRPKEEDNTLDLFHD